MKLDLAAWWIRLLERVARGVPVPAAFRGPTAARRSRVPYSNRDADLEAGIPHGQPGAKLIRKARAQQLTKFNP